MRILLIVDCYLPEQKSSAILVHELAEEFGERGNSVTILAPSSALKNSFEVEQSRNLRIVRYRSGGIKGAPLAVRAVNEMLLSANAMRARSILGREHFDLIVFYSPSIFFGPLVSYLKRRLNVPAYLVLRDIFPDWAVQTGVLRKGLAYRVFKVFEKLQYRAADHIGVETRGSVLYFDRSPHQNKVSLLRNWTRTDPVLKPPARLFRRELGLMDKVVFVFGGNMGVAQDMDNIVRLAGRMKEVPRAHFLLIGAGSEVERLKVAVASGGLGNVTIRPALPQEQYFEAISQFDVGLISLDKRLQSSSTTGKLLGYLRCGLPVLASVNPGNDLTELLHSSQAGLCSWNGDDEALFRNATAFCSQSLRESMAACSQQLLMNEFSVETIADLIIQSCLPEVPVAQTITA